VLAARTRIDEYYFNDDLVQFFESGNAQDLAAKIAALIEQPERRTELRCNCAELIVSNNWDVRKQEYLGLVDRLTTRRSERYA
jgi:glycosyltransferase involved in cell wall biosynthesis